MNEGIMIGVDLAKNVFQVHGADGKGFLDIRFTMHDTITPVLS